MKKIILFSLVLIALVSCKEDGVPYYGYAVFENGNRVIVNQEAGSIEVLVDTDIKSGEVLPAEGVDWCSGIVQDGVVTINFDKNDGDSGREGNMLIKLGYNQLTLNIYQRSLGINHIEIDNPINDAELSWTATCSDEQVNDGGGVSMIFNIDQTRFWHSAYSPMAPLPHWIVVDLKDEVEINQVRLGWRRNNTSYYVNTKRTEILVSTNGVDFTSTGGVIIREATEGSVASTKYTPYSDCTFPAVKARYVKLNMTESNSANGVCNVAYFKVYMP